MYTLYAHCSRRLALKKNMSKFELKKNDFYKGSGDKIFFTFQFKKNAKKKNKHKKTVLIEIWRVEYW